MNSTVVMTATIEGIVVATTQTAAGEAEPLGDSDPLGDWEPLRDSELVRGWEPVGEDSNPVEFVKDWETVGCSEPV